MSSVIKKTRGSALTELVLATPLALVALALTIWFAMIGVDNLRATYVRFMHERAARVVLEPVLEGDNPLL